MVTGVSMHIEAHLFGVDGTIGSQRALQAQVGFDAVVAGTLGPYDNRPTRMGLSDVAHGLRGEIGIFHCCACGYQIEYRKPDGAVGAIAAGLQSLLMKLVQLACNRMETAGMSDDKWCVQCLLWRAHNLRQERPSLSMKAVASSGPQ